MKMKGMKRSAIFLLTLLSVGICASSFVISIPDATIPEPVPTQQVKEITIPSKLVANSNFVVTPFGGGFGGLGINPFGGFVPFPFGGFGLGFSVRSRPAAPIPDAVTTERQLEAAKIQKAQLEEIIKQLEQRQEKQMQASESLEQQV